MVKPPKKYKDLICGVCGWDTDSEGLCSNECDGPPAWYKPRSQARTSWITEFDQVYGYSEVSSEEWPCTY